MVYTSPGFWLLVVGVVLIVLAAFGVAFGPMNLFELGVGVAFASFLAPGRPLP